MKSSRLHAVAASILGLSLLGAGAAFAATGAGGAQATAAQTVPAAGATRYVTDQFQITLRSGPGINHQILAMLKSGEAVTVIKQDPQTGYSEVQTPGGIQGWVLTRFLMDHPAARAQLAQARKALAADAQKISQLEAQVSKLRGELDTRTRAAADLQTKYAALQKTYQHLRDTASQAVALAEENKTLTQKVRALGQKLAAVEKENAQLRNGKLVRWFLAGGGVLLAGLILGLLLPHLMRRRRDTWFS